MPFRLCNSSAIFARVMNHIFRPFLDDFVLVYLDDIPVFNRRWEDHVNHVKRVLNVLQKEKLYVKISKSEFGKTYLVYLSHIVGGGQLKIDPSKFDVIVKLPKPTNVTEAFIFLGAVQYRRSFIANLFIIASPLHALKNVKHTLLWGGK